MTDKQREMLIRAGLRAEQFESEDRMGNCEDAITEVAEMSANNELSIADLEAAILELAEIIGG